MAPLILPPPPCPDSKIPRPCSPFALCRLPAVSFCRELHQGRRDKILKFLFAAVEERAQFFCLPFVWPSRPWGGLLFDCYSVCLWVDEAFRPEGSPAGLLEGRLVTRAGDEDVSEGRVLGHAVIKAAEFLWACIPDWAWGQITHEGSELSCSNMGCPY